MKKKISLACALAASVLGILTTTTRAQAQCELHPIAISQDALAGAQPGTVIQHITEGNASGNYDFLTWTGDNSAKALLASLDGAGDSYTYVNPAGPADHSVSVGDWVFAKRGDGPDGGKMRKALDALEYYDIVVPVWDTLKTKGKAVAYHITGFARIRILGSHLDGPNRITIQFLDYVNCDGPSSPPA